MRNTELMCTWRMSWATRVQKCIAYLSSITRWNICILLTVQAFVKPSPFRINRPTGSKAKQAGYSSLGTFWGILNPALRLRRSPRIGYCKLKMLCFLVSHWGPNLRAWGRTPIYKQKCYRHFLLLTRGPNWQGGGWDKQKPHWRRAPTDLLDG